MNHLRLYSFLQKHNRERFVSSTEIKLHIGMNPVTVRRCASYAPQTFVSSSEGYKLARYCTATEIENSIRVLMSRAEKILHRARSLQRLSFERNKVTRRTIVREALS